MLEYEKVSGEPHAKRHKCRAPSRLHPSSWGVARLIAVLLFSLALCAPGSALAAANYVYHEQTTRSALEDANATDCTNAQNYVEILAPFSDQAYVLRFRVEYHLYTDQARVYYTIDGSTPSGSLGVGVGTTRVLTADYVCTATETAVITDMCRGVIPAQASGKTIKYIVSAWSSGDKLEVFGNSGTCAGCTAFTNSAQATVFQYTVLGPPIINSQPRSRTNLVGTAALFSVIAGGTPPLSYQWYFSDTNALANLTNATMAIGSVQGSNAGTYRVVVTNPYGSVTSAVAVLSVLLPASIRTQPASVAVAAGSPAAFSVDALGDAPLAYQWRFNGTNLSGATASNYVIASAQNAHAGPYDVVVTNIYGSTTSAVATLTILVPPSIVANPQSLVLTQGQTAIFSVTAAGSEPLLYQWRFGKNDMPGETNRTLTLTNVQALQSGNYSVRVSNGAGQITSPGAALTVFEPLAILQQPQSATNLVASTATFAVAVTGSTPIAYQWYFNTNNPVPGGTNTTLSFTNVQTAQAGAYRVVITNSLGAVTSQVAFLTVVFPPSITQQPTSLTVTQGQTASFAVLATGDNPLRYQWRMNSGDLSGATNSILSISNVQSTSAGTYQVVVSNPFAAVTSAVATLVVAVFDFGDAPSGYPTLLADNGARHRLVPGFYLGNTVDSEQDGQPNANATGDDLGGTNDEDGIFFSGPLRVGQVAMLTVVASTNGLLQGWIDFKANTNWSDAGEQIFTNLALVRGTNQLSFTVPPSAKVGPTFARFRFSSASGLSFTGPAPDGEVEDYAVTIQSAIDLALTMSRPPDPVLVGSNVSYVISITNRGPLNATAVTMANALPDRLSFVSVTASQGTCGNVGGRVTCTLGSLAAGSNAVITILARAVATGTITNTAAVAGAEFELTPADNVASQVSAIVLSPQNFLNPATIVMDALLTGPATPYPSSITLSGYTTAVYKVTATLSNLSHTYPDDLDILLVGPGGQSAMLMSDAGINFNLSNVTLTFDDDAPDTVPNSDQIVDGTFHPTNYPPAEIMPLPAPPPPYVSALSVFKGTDPNGTWSLYVFDDTSEDGGSIGDGWSLTLTTMDTISDLAVTQRETPNPSAVGTNLTFTLTVTNFGPAGASGVKLTDPLPAGLNLLSLTNTSGLCGNSNGVVTCAWDSLAKGAGAVITFVVQPVLGGEFTNSASVAGQQLDQTPTNNIASTVITITPVTDLAIASASAPAHALLDQLVTLSLVVTNFGPNLASSVVLSHTLPDGFSFVSATSSQGSCANSGGVVTCALGNLASGAGASVAISGRNEVLGLNTNRCVVSGDQFDNFPANNSAISVTTVDPAADLVLAIAPLPQFVPFTQPVTISMTVSNAGPNAATNILLRDVFPVGATVSSVTSSQGACTNNGAGGIACDLGSLASGEAALVNLIVVPSALGLITNSAVVSSTSADPNLTNNSAVTVSTVVPATDLGVIHLGRPNPLWRGDNLTYSIVVTNNGPIAATGVVLQDTLPGSMSFISVNSTQGSCTNQSGILTCNLGNLPNAGQALVTVLVRPGSLGTITNRARITANEADLVLTNNDVIQTTTVVAPAGFYTNLTRINIPESGPAAPYPSTLLVSGLTGAVVQVRAVLTNLSHTFPDDLDILLVAPNGRSTLLMSDAGGENDITNVVLKFDDQALQFLPDNTQIFSGTNRPTDYEPGDVFPAPAPAGPYGTNLSVFNGMDGNGTWSLYVLDDTAKDRGTLDGWSLEIATGDPLTDLAISSVDLPPVLPVGSNLVFKVTLANRGPALATQVRLTDRLPAELGFLGATASQGGCTNNQGLLNCDLGNLPKGSNAIVSISLMPLAAATVTNLANVTGKELDLDLSNNASNSIVVLAFAPSISAQPQSVGVTNTETVVLSVTASGTDPLSYQWLRNSVPIPGATNSSFELDNISQNDAGPYQVRVTNFVGTALSAVANVVVLGPPSISAFTDQIIDEDTASPLIPFTISDVESPADSLTVAGSSSNPALIPDVNLLFGGTGSNRTLRLIPATNQFGISQITVRVTDPDGGATSRSFQLTVRPVNDPPVISVVPDQSTLEDTPSAAIPFTVSDPESAPSALVVSAVSSNPSLVPSANLVLGGSDNNRTITATPLPDQNGTTIISLTVTDEAMATASVQFRLTVVPVNDPPTLAPISNLVIDEDSGLQTVPLTGISAGPSNEVQRLRLTAASSNPSLIGGLSITYTNPNSFASLSFVPQTNANGTATITVTVNDGATQNNLFSQTFTVQVRPVNDPPTISHPGDQSTLEDTPISLPIIVTDDSPADSLVLSATSSNPILVPATNVVFGGSGPNRTVTILPGTNQFGVATLTLKVTDTNGAVATDSFVLTINSVNDPPTIDPVSNRTINEDAGQQTITLTGIGPGATNETEAVTLTASSSNPAIIPTPSLTYTNPNPTATLRFTPALHATGIVVITITANDGRPQNSTTTRAFTVTINPLNSPPTISGLANLPTPEDTPVTVPFVIDDAQTPAALLTVASSSSNTNLVPNSNLFLNGATTNRALTIIPAPGQTGSVTITLTVGDGITNTISSFVLTVAPVNDPPTLDPIPDQVINEGSGFFNVNFTGVGSGATNETQTLSVTAVSSNSTLMTIQSVTYTSPGSSGSVRLRPASTGQGTAVIAVTVNDNGASNNLVTRTFTVFVKAATNTVPTISTIADKTTPEDTPIGPIVFTVNDAQTPAGSLTLSAGSSNPSLIPPTNIVFGGSGSNRTVTLTPAPNQNGAATITISVQDSGFGMTNTSFQLSVSAVNDAPLISSIADQTMIEDGPVLLVPFTVSDVETPAGNLIVTAHSTNSALIPDANLVVGGSGTNRVLAITPLSNQNGTNSITLTVSDGLTNATRSFLLTVTPVNDPPTISAIADQTTPQDTATAPIPFVVNDLETPPASLTLSAVSSDLTLVPLTNITFGGTGSNRTVTILPATNQSGAATITLTVQDGNASSASSAFLLNVRRVNHAPTLDPIPDLVLNPNSPPRVVSLSGITSGATNEIQALAVAAVSSAPGIVPDPAVSYTSANASGTLTVAPLPGVSGTATISVTVNDGQSSNNLFTRTFNVTVTQPPVIFAIPDQTTDEDTPLSVPFVVNDLETAPANLVVQGVSSNPVLLPNAALIFGGTGSNRTLTFLPATNAFGTALITLTVSDSDTNSTQTSFLLTVNPVADVPVILTQPQGRTVLEGTSVSFTVSAASSEGSLTYQWQRDNADLPGQTNPTLTLAAAQLSDAGAYRAIVSNSEASAFSAAAQLVVNGRPQLLVTRAAGVTRLSFPTLTGLNYTLEFTPALVQTNWATLTNLPGDGLPHTIDDSQPVLTRRFYRLRLQ
jgi:uncharacterized repeat protein (TIGR01451 family)